MTAALQVRDGTADRTISELNVIDAGSVDRAIQEVRMIGPDGVDRVVFSALTNPGGGGGSAGITVYPEFVQGVRSSSSTVAVTSRETTVTVSGGVAPFTYLWSQVSGDPMTIGGSTTATATFGANVAPGDTLSGTFKCTVTDAAGISADSPTVTATLNNIGGTL